MSIASVDLRRFRASLARAKAAPDFLPRFYDRFMAGSPETARLFHGRDMARIQGKLGMTLAMVDDNAGAQPGLDMYLEMLGRIHGRLHITATQVVAWKESALATVAECDPLFNVAIRGAWEAVLDDLIAKLGIGGSSA